MFLEWCFAKFVVFVLCWPKIKDVHHYRTKFQHETVLENIFKISYMKHLTIILTGMILYQLYVFCVNQNSRKATISVNRIFFFGVLKTCCWFRCKSNFKCRHVLQSPEWLKHFFRVLLLFGSIYLQSNMKSKLVELIFDCKDYCMRRH